jgi:hypothetical protein
MKELSLITHMIFRIVQVQYTIVFGDTFEVTVCV